MAHLLLFYGSTEGQTAKIAAYMADALRAQGHTVDLTTHAPPGPLDESVDAVVVGASVHAGRHQDTVVQFIEDHRQELACRPSAFFSVSLTAALGAAAERAKIETLVHSFLEEAEWTPDIVATLGGALRYTQYGFLKRFLMKQISRRHNGPTDTSRDYEFTDWQRVDRFVERVLRRVTVRDARSQRAADQRS
jgi:menaquinone-dependent protoporphyrinogen oxidase